jgi:hypothetical protein
MHRHEPVKSLGVSVIDPVSEGDIDIRCPGHANYYRVPRKASALKVILCPESYIKVGLLLQVIKPYRAGIGASVARIKADCPYSPEKKVYEHG